MRAGCTTIEYDTTAHLTVDVARLVEARNEVAGMHLLVVIDYFGLAQRFSAAERSALREAFTIVVRDAAQGVPLASDETVTGAAGGFGLYSIRKATGWPEGCIVIATPEAPALQRPQAGWRDLLLARSFLAFEAVTREWYGAPLPAAVIRRRLALKRRARFGLWPHPATPWLLHRVDLEALARRRRRNAAILFAATGGWPLSRPLDERDCPYYVPVLTRDPDALAAALHRADVEVTRFWPVAERAAKAGWRNAAAIARSMLCVPTHHGVTVQAAHRIARVISEHHALARSQPPRPAPA